MAAAFALHLAFPRVGAWWVIPFALAVLFRVWMVLPPRAALMNGCLAGLIFFALSFAWFGETAGKLAGPFAFVIDIGPALIEMPAFAVTALVVSVSARNAPLATPLFAAAAYAGTEWARSSGFLGCPFGQLALPLVDSPLRPLAAFVGTYGLSFAIALLAAAIAGAAGDRRWRIPALGVAVALALAVVAADRAWPARTLSPPGQRVVAIQGNIAQSIKATPDAILLAIERYTAMTRAAGTSRPAFVVWPETVILTDLDQQPQLRERFSQLARTIGAEIFVGTLQRVDDRHDYNVIVPFLPDGTIGAPLAKRQLVPFAEYLPLPDALRTIPLVDLIGHFASGRGTGVDPASGAGILICWESVFGDIALDEVRAGARVLVVATDDAWFGTTDGPAQHTQATTLRAVETGRWIVRAAATGISGIVGPDGAWRAQSGLETEAAVVGALGAPVGTAYAAIGPLPFGLGFALLGLMGLVPWRRR